MQINYAPVALFCYLRKDHLEKTLDALSKNILANQTEVFIFSDGPRNKEQEPKVEEIRLFLNNYSHKSIFKKFTIIESKINKGLANSIINGVTEILEKYNKIIVLEDDLITSKFFLNYMNDSLAKFENNEKIWSISGYSPKSTLEKDISEYYFIERPWSWGWGTWKNRWSKVKWDVKSSDYFKENKKEIKKFNKCGKDLGEMLKAQLQNRKYINSWYVRFAYFQFKYNGLTLYPIKSYIKNIGIDGSGTHSSQSNAFRWNVELNENYDKNIIEKISSEDIDEKMQKEFYKLGQRQYYKGIFLRIIDNLELYDVIRKIQKLLRI